MPQAAASLLAASPPLLLSPFVLAELDYLLPRGSARRPAPAYSRRSSAVHALAPMSRADVGSARRVIDQHADLGISLADASIVVLAERHQLADVLTLDQRHFRVLSARGRPFRVLPADG